MKKIIIISLSIVILVGTAILFILSKEQPTITITEDPNQEENISVLTDLKFEYYQEIYLNEIVNVNKGELKDNHLLDTKELGEKELSFTYVIDDELLEGSISYEVVDITPPLLNVRSSYTVEVNSENELIDSIMCADNHDKEPICEFIGEYDKNTVGTYNVVYQMSDSSNNKVQSNVTINVVEKIESSTYEPTQIPLEDIILAHKTDNTRIGIDVSKWQEDINWQQVRDAGVEFVILRIGYGWGENKIDPMFEEYYEGASNAGLDIGLYFYSYADSIEEAKEQATWIVETLNDREIQLPIAYDWEEWSNYNAYKFSLTDLNNTAYAFMEEIEKHGYEAMNYGSANYLRTVWNTHDYKTWLAHYTEQTNYEGEYYMWQLTSSAIVPGIKGNTDVNIMYK